MPISSRNWPTTTASPARYAAYTIGAATLCLLAIKFKVAIARAACSLFVLFMQISIPLLPLPSIVKLNILRVPFLCYSPDMAKAPKKRGVGRPGFAAAYNRPVSVRINDAMLRALKRYDNTPGIALRAVAILRLLDDKAITIDDLPGNDRPTGRPRAKGAGK